MRLGLACCLDFMEVGVDGGVQHLDADRLRLRLGDRSPPTKQFKLMLDALRRGVGQVVYGECSPSRTVTQNVGGIGWIGCVALSWFVSPCAVLTHVQADLDVF